MKSVQESTTSDPARQVRLGIKKQQIGDLDARHNRVQPARQHFRLVRHGLRQLRDDQLTILESGTAQAPFEQPRVNLVKFGFQTRSALVPERLETRWERQR